MHFRRDIGHKAGLCLMFREVDLDRSLRSSKPHCLAGAAKVGSLSPSALTASGVSNDSHGIEVKTELRSDITPC